VSGDVDDCEGLHDLGVANRYIIHFHGLGCAAVYKDDPSTKELRRDAQFGRTADLDYL